MNARILILAIAMIFILTGCQSKPAVNETETIESLQSQITQLKQELAEAKGESADPIANTQKSPQAFDDVDEAVPTADMINDLASLKAFKDLGNTFKPYEPITRGEYVRWVFDAYNRLLPPEKQIRFSPSYKVPFQDIATNHPAYKFVQALSNAGFSVGYDSKTFKPDKPLTREEMIAIKHGIDGGEMYSNVATNFSDDGQIDPRFHNSVYSEQIFNNDGPRGNNIMRAFGAIKAFKPKEVVLRYEAAATLWQMDHRGTVTADAVLGRKPAS